MEMRIVFTPSTWKKEASFSWESDYRASSVRECVGVGLELGQSDAVWEYVTLLTHFLALRLSDWARKLVHTKCQSMHLHVGEKKNDIVAQTDGKIQGGEASLSNQTGDMLWRYGCHRNK